MANAEIIKALAEATNFQAKDIRLFFSTLIDIANDYLLREGNRKFSIEGLCVLTKHVTESKDGKPSKIVTKARVAQVLRRTAKKLQPE